MPDGELVEIASGRLDAAAEPLDLSLEHPREEAEDPVAVRQLELPARVMRDGARIPQCVGAIEDRRCAMDVAQRPIFVEPADVADLPEHRVDDGQHRPHQLLRGQIVRQSLGSRADLTQVVRELGCARARYRSVGFGAVHGHCCYHARAPLVTVRQPDHGVALGKNLPAPRAFRARRDRIRWHDGGADGRAPCLA